MSAILTCRDLSMHFGAVKAVNGVSFDVEEGALHTVIGPNGAGKTTLFNCMTGELVPSAGEVVFDGTRISGLPPHALPALGIARSFQRTSIFSNLTVAENVWVSAFRSVTGGRIELFHDADRHVEVRDAIAAALEQVGLARHSGTCARELGHGDQRLLDLAVALAPRPRLLLLDEPMAGLSRVETHRVMELIEALKRRYTLLLIEHKMDVVMRISDRITVMNFGEVLAEGGPDEIRGDERVRAAYLGRRAS